MTGREHIAIGASTTALALLAMQAAGDGVSVQAMAPALVAAAAGSLAPDLDHPGSLASMSIPATLISYAGVFLVARHYDTVNPSVLPVDFSALGPEWVLVAWASLAIGLTLFLVSFVFGAMFGHRGIVHSVAFGLGASLLVGVGCALFSAPASLAVPFAWGWMAHLMADAMTPAGLSSLFWPLGDRL